GELHTMVTSALTNAMKAFEDLDSGLAETALNASEECEQLHHSIEEKVFATISNHQPKEIDLRRLVAYLSTSAALQKVGRYSTKISDIVKLSGDLDHFKELVSLPYLSELANSALEISMRAILNEDLSEIDELEKLEAQSDSEAADMFHEIAEFLSRRRDISEISMYYIIVGRYCERASDQAIIIAESATYMITGERTKLGLAYEEEPASLLD
ncbi:MAG: phosphate signaling complex PhoU family protein, partial [Candidatus Thorarchaeota archaeon]